MLEINPADPPVCSYMNSKDATWLPCSGPWTGLKCVALCCIWVCAAPVSCPQVAAVQPASLPERWPCCWSCRRRGPARWSCVGLTWPPCGGGCPAPTGSGSPTASRGCAPPCRDTWSAGITLCWQSHWALYNLIRPEWSPGLVPETLIQCATRFTTEYDLW